MSDAEKDMIKKDASPSGDSDAVYKIFYLSKAFSFMYIISYLIIFSSQIQLICKKVVPSLKNKSRKRTTLSSNNIAEETVAVPSSVVEPKSKRTKTGNRKKIVKKESSNDEINDVITRTEVDHDGDNKTKEGSNKPKRKLGAWTPEEDRLLLESLEKIAGEGKWKRVADIMNNGRNNDNCRHRFNHLKNQLVKGTN
ncbi:21975_t:CDS:1 [Cetraspora pellucida]|uniref:21975_t:CDS:1 n=1 Tax=Cetraspora pellucida TaxID=1433469 RepID=A0A9N9CWS4_9GLOM|nr:21975_t:CDS:1 [Cetraspora pellucida]